MTAGSAFLDGEVPAAHQLGEPASYVARTTGALWRNKGLAIIGLLWVLLVLAAVAPALFTSGNPNAEVLTQRLLPPGSPGHFLGTDQLGNDMYTRLVYGTRTSLLIGAGAVAIRAFIGVALGIIAGYSRRYEKLVNAFVSVNMAFPGLMLALVVVIMFGHATTSILILVLGLTGWTSYTRSLERLVRSMRQREFVLAARTSGRGAFVTAFRHLIPNMLSSIRVLIVVDVARVILTAASLSFLGLGVQPPTVEWGLMLGSGEDYVYTAWWVVVLPGALLTIVILSLNAAANILQSRSELTVQIVAPESGSE